MDSGQLSVSYWRDRKNSVWRFLCPICKSDRRLAFQPGFGRRHQVFQILFSASFFTLICWPWFQWKGMVSFVPIWTVFELIYRSRMRAAVGCPHCGFDPYLFAVDFKRAQNEMDVHWRKKFADRGLPYPVDSPKSLDSRISGSPSPEDQLFNSSN